MFFKWLIFTQQHVTNKSKMTKAWKLSHEYLSLYQACYAKMEQTEEDITIKIEFKERRLEYGNCNC